MYSSRAAALTPQLPCRSTGPKWKLRVHNPGAETTATCNNQNSKHNQHATRRNNRSWLDLPLEIPTLLLGRAAMADHICSLVPAPVSGTVDICGTARRVAKNIEAGPPEGILSRFNDMFEEKEKATHIRAAEVMRELGWDATDQGELLQNIPFCRPSARPQCTAKEHAYAARRSFGVVVGVTISFSVRCNDDCYRASLTMHTDVASLSNSATLLQCTVCVSVSSTVDGSRLC